LLACGARPRRLLRTGVDALTPSELRVAQLAAAGHSNREIAQALFVSRKTVETHLGGIYRKLGVNAREHLAAKLQDPPPDAKPAAAREAVAP
jgi:DNA-binding CsgD family transcriptional regulator